MTEEFIRDTDKVPTPEALTNASSQSSQRGELVKVLIIGSPKGVNNTICTLYSRGFAEVTAWSPLQPTSNPGEVMSVLSRQILIK